MNTIKQNLIEVFEIEKLPVDKQEETLARIGKIIFQAVLLRILPLLDETDTAQFEKLADEGARPEDLFEFFMNKIPNFTEIVAEEAENFKKEAIEAGMA